MYEKLVGRGKNYKFFKGKSKRVFNLGQPPVSAFYILTVNSGKWAPDLMQNLGAHQILVPFSELLEVKVSLI